MENNNVEQNLAEPLTYSREYYKAKSKLHYERHPEKKQEREFCHVCGIEYLKLGKSNHMKTKKHQMALNASQQKSEMELQNELLKEENEKLKLRIREMQYMLDDPKKSEQMAKLKMNLYHSFDKFIKK